MPMDKADYPVDWASISRRIRFERAGGKCEGSPLYPDCRAAHDEPHPITGSTVVLTTAHLDHDTKNNSDENLRAMCQRCHLAHDADYHQRTREANRRAGMIDSGQGFFDWLDFDDDSGKEGC